MSVADLSEKRDMDILLVEDDKFVRETLQILIQSFGYECDTAVNGFKAVEKLKGKKFDVVVTDVSMPEMDGLELLAHIKNKHEYTDVIIITGYTDKASYAEVIKSGAVDFLKKPFEKEELQAKLHRVERERSMVQELEELSIRDELTGLYNRRYFSLKLEEEVGRAQRQGHQVYLAILDVDDFKSYNDAFGHPAGDIVLDDVGRILNTCTRRNVDFTFRYGGDEFAAILTQTNEKQAVKVISRVLDFFSRKKYGDTTLSVGLVRCLFLENLSWAENADTMVHRADKALYLAKNAGKNQIVSNGEK
jgi:two-component system, cell cycle response regulator